MPLPIELNLARIGNSRGIRLPAKLIRKHALESGVILEERGDELVLRPKGDRRKLGWSETAREMIASTEEWNAWDTTLADGLESIPWDSRVCERQKNSSKGRSRRKS